jgi:integrase
LWGKKRYGPWIIQRAIRDIRGQIDELPEAFSFHDLRHYYASVLIASIGTVATALRRSSERQLAYTS